MQLRPELMPPPLDTALVAHLGRLAERLDGARLDQADDDLEEFNRLAATSLILAEFQGISKSEDGEDFVRRVLFQQRIVPVPDLTHEEMTEIVKRVSVLTEDSDFFFELFLVHCKHPAGSDLIYYPHDVPELPQDREPTPAEIASLALLGE